MRNVFVTLVLAIGLMLTSCSVTKTSTAKSIDIYGPGVIQNPVLVDLDVAEAKVSATASGQNSQLKFIKQQAVSNAVEENKADVLVEPTFKSTTSGSTTTVTVTGWPANYKNFRPLQEKDVELLKSGVYQKAEVAEVAESTPNTGAGKVVLWILGIGAIVAAALLL